MRKLYHFQLVCVLSLYLNYTYSSIGFVQLYLIILPTTLNTSKYIQVQILPYQLLLKYEILCVEIIVYLAMCF